jgi:NAD(P) transhydrogenase subunit alpha
MLIGVLKETYTGERRVALVPASVPLLAKKGFSVIIEPDAGLAAGYTNEQYTERGASIASSREDVLGKAEILAYVRALGANPDNGLADLSSYRKGQIIVGATEPLSAFDELQQLAKTGATVFALELIPRITRAQTMDIISSMATVAGYKAVLMAANELPSMFPLLMTAAGTVKPAKVFIVGVGVAGLQAISTARRLGAVVQAYDVRPAVKEQVHSLGAKFVELDLKTEGAEDARGYSKEMDEEFLSKQREMMGHVVAESDVVITTAAVPGKKAPILVTEDMVKKMRPGSLVVDLAAERGGNCDVTRPGESVDVGRARVLGPLNVPASVPHHASQMYSQNVTTFLLHVFGKEDKKPDMEDQITKDTMIIRGGEIISGRVRELMGLTPPAPEGS